MEKTKLFYFYDALCGWCFGFSPVIQKLYQDNKEKYDFQIISGGMMTGERVGSINQIAPYIKTAYKRVEELSGVKFGERYLNETLADGTSILNSLRPAIALSIVKSLKPELAFECARLLHETIYVDGLGVDTDEFYLALAEKINFDKAEFLNLMSSEVYLKLAEEDFMITKDYVINGFPTLVAEKNAKFYLVSNGYTSIENIEISLENLDKM